MEKQINHFRNRILQKLQEYSPQELSSVDRTPAAVLVPFFQREGEPYLLFTKRTRQVQYHRGEICFPGGAYDTEDRNLRATALRELYEEVSVPADNVEILGRLNTIRTVSSYFLVVPYVGYLKNGTEFQANRIEVEELLEIPFHHFQDPSVFSQETRVIEERSIDVYHYRWQSEDIWGLTGRILKEILDLLK